MSVFHDTIGAYAAAIGALDPIAFAACFARECELHDPVGAPPHRGLDGARAMLAGFLPLLESIHFRSGEVFLNGRSAAFTWMIEATGKNGRAASAHGIDVVEFDESGKIVRTSGYWDPGPFVGALTA